MSSGTRSIPIRRVAVLGAGVMGSGIAAHCANAGIPVLLLDIVPPKLTDAEKASKAKRDGFAAGALDKLKKARPAALDRKSTRLNSSHPSISYAVFCLKKKKKPN